MRVTVRVHNSPQPEFQFREWRRTLPGTAEDQRRWGRWYLESMGHAVMNGLAPAAVLEGADGDLIRWEYILGVEFTLLRRLVSKSEMELIVLGIKLVSPRPND